MRGISMFWLFSWTNRSQTKLSQFPPFAFFHFPLHFVLSHSISRVKSVYPINVWSSRSMVMRSHKIVRMLATEAPFLFSPFYMPSMWWTAVQRHWKRIFTPATSFVDFTTALSCSRKGNIFRSCHLSFLSYIEVPNNACCCLLVILCWKLYCQSY